MSETDTNTVTVASRIYEGIKPLIDKTVTISTGDETEIKHGIERVIKNELGLVDIARKMQIYYEYERHYFDLAKEYKDEIKFIHGLQEELRKERSKFFGETLERVFISLNNAKVSDGAIAAWTSELVKAYTGSLDSSEHIVNENLSVMIGEIRDKMNNTISSIKGSITEKSEGSGMKSGDGQEPHTL